MKEEVRSAPEARMTRRRLACLAVGLAAGLTVRAEAGGNVGEPPAESPPAEDPRLTRLEKERAAPLTESQRKGLPSQLKDLDDGSAALRKFPLADGGSEPDIVFRPTRPNARPKA